MTTISNVTTSRRSGYSMEADFGEIIAGKVPLPNFEELPLARGVASIAAGGGLRTVDGVRYAKVPGSTSTWGHWARYFLGTTQGGALDGTGYLIWYDVGQGGVGEGHVGRFAICKHEKVSIGSHTDARRGWHPGYCGKCGLNMTVDSSD